MGELVNNAEENSFHTSKSWEIVVWGEKKISGSVSPNLLGILLLCLVATSFQSVHRRGTGLTEVDYSTAFGWLGQTARQLPEKGFSRD